MLLCRRLFPKRKETCPAVALPDAHSAILSSRHEQLAVLRDINTCHTTYMSSCGQEGAVFIGNATANGLASADAPVAALMIVPRERALDFSRRCTADQDVAVIADRC